MKKMIVVFSFSLLACNAIAGEWTYIDHDDTAALWVQTDSMWRSSGNVKMWHMYDYQSSIPSLGASSSPKGSRSIVGLAEYDCADRRTRPLQGTAYEDAKGTGRIAWTLDTEGAWGYIKPGSEDEKRWNIACKTR